MIKLGKKKQKQTYPPGCNGSLYKLHPKQQSDINLHRMNIHRVDELIVWETIVTFIVTVYSER